MIVCLYVAAAVRARDVLFLGGAGHKRWECARIKRTVDSKGQVGPGCQKTLLIETVDVITDQSDHQVSVLQFIWAGAWKGGIPYIRSATTGQLSYIWLRLEYLWVLDWGPDKSRHLKYIFTIFIHFIDTIIDYSIKKIASRLINNENNWCFQPFTLNSINLADILFGWTIWCFHEKINIAKYHPPCAITAQSRHASTQAWRTSSNRVNEPFRQFRTILFKHDVSCYINTLLRIRLLLFSRNKVKVSHYIVKVFTK